MYFTLVVSKVNKSLENRSTRALQLHMVPYVAINDIAFFLKYVALKLLQYSILWRVDHIF